MLQVACPQCGAQYKVRPDFAGRSMRCPKCQGAIPVPSSEPHELTEVIGTGKIADVTQPGRAGQSRVLWATVGVVVAAAALGAAGWWLFLSDRPSAVAPQEHAAPVAALNPTVPALPAPEPTPGQLKPPAGEEAPPQPKKPKTLSVGDLVERIDDGVVLITALGEQKETIGLVSGFVIDASGLVATNYHVLKEAHEAQVQTHDGTRIDVRGVRACDPGSDLVILELAKRPDKVEVLELATDGGLRPGQEVIALGHPRGFRFTVTSGIISAVRTTEELPRPVIEFLKAWPDLTWIQSTAAISGGSSGGPLLNREGKVIGLNTWMARGENLGFAVHARHLADVRRHPNPEAVPVSNLTTFAEEQRAIYLKLSEERLLGRLDAAAAANRAAAVRVRDAGGTVRYELARDRDRELGTDSLEEPSFPFEPFFVTGVFVRERREGVRDLSFLNGLTELQSLDLRTPEWTDGDILGLADLPKLAQLTITGRGITDVAVSHLKRFGNLQRLGLDETSVSDQGLAELKDLKTIRSLWLPHTSVGDQGVAQLKSLKTLQMVSLNGTKVTDAVGGTLSELPALSSISLSDTNVTDRILPHLLRHERLSMLSLDRTRITDDGLNTLVKLQHLGVLHLSGTRISEAKLGDLAKLPRLSSLYLDDLPISDEGLRKLSAIRGLRFLAMNSPVVSDEQLKRFKQTMPKCSVRRKAPRKKGTPPAAPSAATTAPADG
jgi:S1-C subfamily serine protease